MNITLPHGFLSTLNSAFAYCYNIKSFKFEGPLTIIPDYCFAGCMALTDFVFPEKITDIGKEAFSGCKSLKALTIPDRIEILKLGVFQNRENLVVLNLPKSLEYICDRAFYGCKSLKIIDRPKNGKRIGKGVFVATYSLKTIISQPVPPPEVQDSIPDYSQDMLDMGLTSITDDVTFIVLTKAYNAYSKHEYWGKFEIETFTEEYEES